SITLSPSGTRVVFCPTSGAPLQVWDAGADKVTQIVVDGQRLAFLDEDTLAALSTYPSGFDMFAITVLSLKSPLQRQTTAVTGAQGRVEPQISGWIDPPDPEDTSHRPRPRVVLSGQDGFAIATLGYQNRTLSYRYASLWPVSEDPVKPAAIAAQDGLLAVSVGSRVIVFESHPQTSNGAVPVSFWSFACTARGMWTCTRDDPPMLRFDAFDGAAART